MSGGPGAGTSASGGYSEGVPQAFDSVLIVSFGGHGDLRRVLRYIATGEAPRLPGITVHPPHDYAASVVLYGLADRGVVPDDQVQPLRDGIETFLLASQLTLVDMTQANATFERARTMQKALPEPAATLMGYVNDRAVTKLGPLLVPYLDRLGADNAAVELIAEIELTPDDLQEIEDAASKITIQGARLPEAVLKMSEA